MYCIRNRNDAKLSIIFYKDNFSELMELSLLMVYFQMAYAHIFLSSLLQFKVCKLHNVKNFTKIVKVV